MLLVSIDPGVHGCLVVEDENKVNVFDTPTFVTKRKIYSGIRKGKEATKTHYDLKGIREIFPKKTGIAVIELVGAMPNDGKAQVSSLMKGAGIWLGFCGAECFEIIEVTPAKWKKALGLPTGATKEDSRQLALKLYPELEEILKRKKDEGRAEGLLLLHYLKEFVLKEKECQKKSQPRKRKEKKLSTEK